MFLFRLAPLLMALLLAQPSVAGMPERVTLEPVDFPPAQLVVIGPEGETSYDRATLERELGTWRLVTATPWRDQPAAFEGVMLRDLVMRHGLHDAPAIRVTAENDYEVTIPADVVSTVPILIATRVDGRPHTRRERGPLQFVIPFEIFKDLGLTERYMVWMAARIEPAQ